MRLYGYTCTDDKCAKETEAMRSTEERHDSPPCQHCGARTMLMIAAVKGIVKNPAVPHG